MGSSTRGAWGRVPVGAAGTCSPRTATNAPSSHASTGGGGAQQGPDPGGTAAVRGLRHPHGTRRPASAGGGGGRGAARCVLRPGTAADPLAALRHRPPGTAEGLFKGAGVLLKPGGVLFTYGESCLGSSGHGIAAAAGRGQWAAPGEDGGHASQQQVSHLPQAVTCPNGTSQHLLSSPGTFPARLPRLIDTSSRGHTLPVLVPAADGVGSGGTVLHSLQPGVSGGLGALSPPTPSEGHPSLS
ncbi:methyltransferase-like 26 isoform X2 [Columba livia]|uniref:methyltransferase-like 26 isoform X2 n=1 Tax=Columba livia TaxID=8932 RepID=UPI0031BAD477